MSGLLSLLAAVAVIAVFSAVAAIAVAVAIAAETAAEVERLIIIEHAAKQRGVGGVQIVDGVVNDGGGDEVLPDDEDRGIGCIGQHLGIGEEAEGWRVDENVGIALAQRIEQRTE